MHALVRHVVRQGVYSSSEIAVLTPYTGQLQKLRSSMRNDFEIVVSPGVHDLVRHLTVHRDNAEGRVRHLHQPHDYGHHRF